ncbi:glutamate-cysteine ligase [Aureococcus anophagefferens]|nr:glutamate-cysteine ligase [Aureococcus anophagefferens]
MGVLTVGRPLSWEEALPHLRYVRDHGVLQFINHYRKYEHITKDALYYGDEIEYGLFALRAGGVALSLRGAAVRATLNARELEERRAIPESGKVTWHPEYGSWMVESTPAVPYSGFTDDLRRVETNMRSRRARLLAALEDGEVAPTMLAVLAPVMLALTAACPILKGLLSDHDVRWNVIEHGVKSYMSARGTAARYNDVEVEVDPWAFEQLTSNGVDALLARHVAHLFVRDPLVLFEGMVEELDDAVATDHFENLQSTNWNSLTDFENAAFTVFCVLVLRVLLSFDLNIYMPMSKVHENMKAAHARDAATTGQFWWRSHLVRPGGAACPAAGGNGDVDGDSVEKMSCARFSAARAATTGSGALVLVYLDSIGCDPGTAERVKVYVDLILGRATGELKTAALRATVASHLLRDSVVSPAIARPRARALLRPAA